jgi:hypothetical protein
MVDSPILPPKPSLKDNILLQLYVQPFGFCNNLHIYFANKALLKDTKSLKPNLPSALKTPKCPQLIEEIYGPTKTTASCNVSPYIKYVGVGIHSYNMWGLLVQLLLSKSPSLLEIETYSSNYANNPTPYL